MKPWKLPWEGGCMCSAVRLRVTLPPLLASACHCWDCQRMSASAYSLTLTIPDKGFELIRGEPVLGGMRANDVLHYHCPLCKNWLFTRIAAIPDIVNLRPAVLDDHGWVVPQFETCTNEKMLWAHTPAVQSYQGCPEPDEFDPLMDLFAACGSRPV
ncbi:MAG: GFA family protein [Pseudomonadota bacterium]